MRAIRIHAYGGPEALQYEELPEPTAGPGQALVRMRAIGLNFIDTYQRSGLYPTSLPRIVGQEGAGEVVAVGPDVTEVNVGDRVAYTGVPGAYAEMTAPPAARLVKLPDDVSYETAAAAMLQGMTAHYLVSSSYPLASGQTCLVHAAAGGVGLLLVQMARMRGATVIGTVSTEEKAGLARQAGADHVILYSRQDFVAEVRRITSGRGVPVVYDSVGKTTFERSLDCLSPRGALVLYGQSSGPVPPFDPQVLNAKGSLSLTRPSLSHHIATRDELAWRAGDVLDWIRTGALAIRIGETHRLANAAEAHRRLEGRHTTGKVLLIP